MLGVIRLTLTRSIAHKVMKEKTTVDLMKDLSSIYEEGASDEEVL